MHPGRHPPELRPSRPDAGTWGPSARTRPAPWPAAFTCTRRWRSIPTGWRWACCGPPSTRPRPPIPRGQGQPTPKPREERTSFRWVEGLRDLPQAAAGIAAERGSPLWRSLTRARELGRAANCHTFRASGITAYLLNGGTLERAQAIAGHESPRTTQLYDRTADDITVEDIERIRI